MWTQRIRHGLLEERYGLFLQVPKFSPKLRLHAPVVNIVQTRAGEIHQQWTQRQDFVPHFKVRVCTCLEHLARCCCLFLLEFFHTSQELRLIILYKTL